MAAALREASIKRDVHGCREHVIVESPGVYGASYRCRVQASTRKQTVQGVCIHEVAEQLPCRHMGMASKVSIIRVGSEKTRKGRKENFLGK